MPTKICPVGKNVLVLKTPFEKCLISLYIPTRKMSLPFKNLLIYNLYFYSII